MYQNRNLGKYNPPKFKKFESVKYPEGEGRIVGITYTGGANWYFIEGNDKSWSEDELSKIS